MDKSLIDYLKQIPEHRDPHGLRHPLWLVLLIIIMGMMSGYWGYRELGRFVERHRRELIKRLQIPKARVPSYSVIRRVMVKLDYKELEKVFNKWSQQYSLIPRAEWISVDDQLKNICQVQHTRHRSVHNFMVNLLGGLIAYTYHPIKPSLDLEYKGLPALPPAIF